MAEDVDHHGHHGHDHDNVVHKVGDNSGDEQGDDNKNKRGNRKKRLHDLTERLGNTRFGGTQVAG